MGLCSRLIALFLFCGGVSFSSPLHSVTIRLLNDSTFHLQADIYTAMGTFEKSVPMAPGEMYIWDSDLSPFNYQGNRPTTPLIVRWLCAGSQPYDYTQPQKNQNQNQKEYESEFGSWPVVPPGSTVTAMGSPSGTKTCVIKKRKSKKTPQKGEIPFENQQNDGSNNWSNDGGQNWTND